MALDKFKARLKAKALAAGANLSQKRIDEKSAKLDKANAEIADDDAAHDAAIDLLYDVADLKELASLDDYNRTKQAREEAERKRKEGKQPGETTDEAPDDTPAWFRKYQEENDKKLNALIQERATATMQQKVSQHEKLKDVNPKLYSKIPLPAKDEDIDTWAAEIAEIYGGIPATSENQPFTPGVTRTPVTTGSKKVDPDLMNFVKNKNEQSKTTIGQAKNSVISNN